MKRKILIIGYKSPILTSVKEKLEVDFETLLCSFQLEIHGGKSTARLIGATDLAKDAATLEEMVKQNRIEGVTKCLDLFLNLYYSYHKIIFDYIKTARM